MIRLDLHGIDCFEQRNLGLPSQQLRQNALPLWIEVLNHNESQCNVGRKRRQYRRECFQTTSRCPNCHYRNIRQLGLGRRSLLRRSNHQTSESLRELGSAGVFWLDLWFNQQLSQVYGTHSACLGYAAIHSSSLPPIANASAPSDNRRHPPPGMPPDIFEPNRVPLQVSCLCQKAETLTVCLNSP